MGWIFFSPIPLTIPITRAKRLKLWLKLLILIAAWASYFVIALTGSSEEAAVAASLLPF